MIDIMSGTDTGPGAETARSHGVLWAFLLIVCVGAAAVGGVYWVRTHDMPAAVNLQASTDAVKTADAAWSRAAQAHNLMAVMGYYSGDAFVLPPNDEMATDKLAIQKIWTDRIAPGTDLSWTPGAATAATSGDLVYLEGFYIATTKAAKGKAPATDRGKHLTIWKKQTDGSWKCVADTWNSDLPAKK